VTERERGPARSSGARARSPVRLLVAALVLQLLIAGMLIWLVAGGSPALHDLISGAPSRVVASPPARPPPAGRAPATP